MMSLNKSKGVIYGLTIGDALGRPTEFMSLSQMKSTYGQEGITDLPDPALYTDDTQMCIAIKDQMRSIVKYMGCEVTYEQIPIRRADLFWGGPGGCG
jgi:ADP-ribosylglycohydrolase